MDLGSLGIDIGIIVAIGSITERIKKIDGVDKFKRFYILIPLILAAVAATAIAINSKAYSAIPLNVIKYVGVTLFGYSFIKKTILKK